METTKAINTRNRIIDSAKKLFRKYGFSNVTMQMIADESATSLSLVKKYFPKKAFIISVIIRNYAYAIKKNVDTVMETENCYGDALMEYLLVINIMFRNLYSDMPARRFHYETMELSEESMDAKPYDFISELYLGIIKQFNIVMSAEEFEARKIQIFGAQMAIGKAYAENVVKFNDVERLEYSISAACRLLSVSQFTYLNYKKKVDKIIAAMDISIFKLL